MMAAFGSRLATTTRMVTRVGCHSRGLKLIGSMKAHPNRQIDSPQETARSSVAPPMPGWVDSRPPPSPSFQPFISLPPANRERVKRHFPLFVGQRVVFPLERCRLGVHRLT